MDKISGLCDELLIKILTSVPTKVAVSTSILSKRWECLWKWLPKLEFDDTDYSVSECERLRYFLDRNLPLHRALVIESFRLHLRIQHFKPEDIKQWVLFAVSRCLRELEVSSYSRERNISSSSLYTCKSLVILKLSGEAILVDVPRMVCLPSLKTLQLHYVTYSDKESFQRLLAICPVLKELSVGLSDGDEMGKLTVSVPSLQNLTLKVPYEEPDELVIDTPSLKYFKLEDQNNDHTCLIGNVPELREAYIDVDFSNINNLIGSITSVKRLTICSLPGDVYVFNQLEHLKICLCNMNSPNLLVQWLNVSPNLRVLDLYGMEDHGADGMLWWNQPSTVPGCMLSSLQIFNWSVYLGRPAERDLAVYILENARLLKTATISDCFVSKLEMIKELSFSSRASTTCRLVFD